MIKRIEDHYRKKLFDKDRKAGKKEYRLLFHKYTLQVKRDGKRIFTIARIKTMERKQWWIYTRETYHADGSLESITSGRYYMNL